MKKETLVKICGIKDVEIAKQAVAAGADLIGLNFIPTSRNFVTLEQAKEIVANISGKVKVVGVFQDQSLDYVQTIADSLALDYVQLHGKETPHYCEKLNRKLIKVFNLESEFDIEATARELGRYKVEYYLLDRAKRGEGGMLNLRSSAKLAERFPLIFAGGLTSENVGEVVKIVRPAGVDVSGGVETEGEKDVIKIRKFIEKAKFSESRV